MGSRVRHRGWLTVSLAAAFVLAAAAAGSVFAAPEPYTHVWRVQTEVGGDRGGRTEATVLSSSSSMKADGGAYVGSVGYSDRLAVEDPMGGVLVQVSDIRLDLTGLPAGGGGAMGGLFAGTARLDDYLGLSWDDAVAGRLPDAPSRSATYEVEGRWGAALSSGSASGELQFDSATVRSARGGIDRRDPSWFNRYGTPQAQSFTTLIIGVVAPGGTSAGGAGSAGAGVGSYLQQGLTGVALRSPVAVPVQDAIAARRLRDAKPKGATLLPDGSVCIDLDVAGHVLDAKNRAAGVSACSGAGERALRGWERARETSVARSAEATTAELTRLLAVQSSTPGARELAGQVAATAGTVGSADDGTQALLGRWLAAARALAGKAPSVLAATAEVARGVRYAAIPRSGPAADGLLADADAYGAPASSLVVERFGRRASEDFRDGAGGSAILREVLAGAERVDGRPAVGWLSAQGPRRSSPDAWLAYRRADAVTFWLAGKGGPVALRDGTLAGWAYTTRRVDVVAAARAGSLLATLPARVATATAGR